MRSIRSNWALVCASKAAASRHLSRDAALLFLQQVEWDGALVVRLQELAPSGLEPLDPSFLLIGIALAGLALPVNLLSHPGANLLDSIGLELDDAPIVDDSRFDPFDLNMALTAA